jgi:DNA-binding transcriptional regulator LsrR (DeoR family)
MADLELDLEKKYHLREVSVVAVSDPKNPASAALELAPAAAACLVRCLSGHEVVGTTWGRTIRAMVDALPSRSWPDLTIAQLSGGLGPVGDLEHSTDVAQRMAQKLNARLRLLPAPGIVSTKAAAQALWSDSQIAGTLELAARADVAVVGLGIPAPDSVLLRDGTIVTQEDLRDILEAGAVGDIGLRFVDASGMPLDLELNERIIGLSLDQIRRIPYVIGVAAGEAKRDIIRAALRGEILDALVTDLATAEALLAETDWRAQDERR